MKRFAAPLAILALALLVALAPAYAQGRGGGPPPSRGAGGAPPAGAGAPGPGSHGPRNTGGGTSGLAHSSPNDVLSHNTAIAGKINTLTGEDAKTACGGFKNLGQCVAAAHVAKNLDIPGGFDALKKAMLGPPSESLGKAIQGLSPNANAKDEVKKANKQATDDLKEGGS